MDCANCLHDLDWHRHYIDWERETVSVPAACLFEGEGGVCRCQQWEGEAA